MSNLPPEYVPQEVFGWPQHLSHSSCFNSEQFRRLVPVPLPDALKNQRCTFLSAFDPLPSATVWCLGRVAVALRLAELVAVIQRQPEGGQERANRVRNRLLKVLLLGVGPREQLVDLVGGESHVALSNLQARVK